MVVVVALKSKYKYTENETIKIRNNSFVGKPTKGAPNVKKPMNTKLTFKKALNNADNTFTFEKFNVDSYKKNRIPQQIILPKKE